MTREAFAKKFLRRLFKAVGRTWTPEATSRERWYTESTWTSAEKAKFRLWLAKTIVRDLGYTEKAADRRAEWLMFQYTWEVNDAKDEKA